MKASSVRSLTGRWESRSFEVVGPLPLAFKHPTHSYVDALVMFQSL
jgi:hypothetical protein